METRIVGVTRMVGGMSERVLRRRELRKHKTDCSQCHDDVLVVVRL